MANLYGVIGQSTPEHLLADPMNGHPIAIPVEPGSGALDRGTLMYRKSTGFWAPAATANVVDTNMFAVLNEAVDGGSAPASGETAVAENAAAYQTGRFISGKVLYYNTSGSKYDVPTLAMEAVLAGQGIFFDHSAESAPEFTNSVTGS